MEHTIKDKIAQFKRMSDNNRFHPVPSARRTTTDSLSSAIRSQKDADGFMEELKAAVKKAREVNYKIWLSSIQTGAWSLVFSQPRTSLSTPAVTRRSKICGLKRK